MSVDNKAEETSSSSKQRDPKHREFLNKSREPLLMLPSRQFVEIPGRPHIVYEIRDYTEEQGSGAATARLELPFLFKPFEVGQKMNRRMKGTNKTPAKTPADKYSSITHYLDWAVTAKKDIENLDFFGFRVIVLFARICLMWPPPDAYDHEVPKTHPDLGAPKSPLPCLLAERKALCAAMIRSGPGYLEIPFFATKESKRNKGYGRCLLEAIEDIARALNVPKLLLCSTDDQPTIDCWNHLGFIECKIEELNEWGVQDGDLIHMTNTIQMAKILPEREKWKSMKIKHFNFVQRIYLLDNLKKIRIEDQDDKSNVKVPKVDHNDTEIDAEVQIDLETKKEDSK